MNKPVAWIYERRERQRVSGGTSPRVCDFLTHQPPAWRQIYDTETPLFLAPEPYAGIPMPDAQLNMHYEASKFDKVDLVGSEVRQIIGELRHLRKAFSNE